VNWLLWPEIENQHVELIKIQRIPRALILSEKIPMRTYKLIMIATLACLILMITACLGNTRGVSPVFTSPVVSNSPLSIVYEPTIEVPLPESGKGNVHGTLVFTNFPLSLETTELYLGSIFTSENGEFSTYYFNRDEHPRGQWINVKTGEFLFKNVAPGEYVLIMWWDVQNYAPVYRTETFQAITVTVTSGQITELGLIVSNQ